MLGLRNGPKKVCTARRLFLRGRMLDRAGCGIWPGRRCPANSVAASGGRSALATVSMRRPTTTLVGGWLDRARSQEISATGSQANGIIGRVEARIDGEAEVGGRALGWRVVVGRAVATRSALGSSRQTGDGRPEADQPLARGNHLAHGRHFGRRDRCSCATCTLKTTPVYDSPMKAGQGENAGFARGVDRRSSRDQSIDRRGRDRRDAHRPTTKPGRHRLGPRHTSRAPPSA